MSKEIVVKTSGSGICFGSLLTIVFIVLKLTGYIAWSWWWVLSPIWIPVVFMIGVFLSLLLAFIPKHKRF